MSALLTPLRRARRRPSTTSTVLGRLIARMSRREKAAVVALLGVVAIAGVLAIWQVFQGTPLGSSGTYSEGIVASSLADVEPTVQALTSIGLLAPDSDGNLTGLLAERWNLSDDATTFEFTLKPGIDRGIVLQAYDPNQDNSLFAGTTVEPIDERGVRVTLKNSYAPFIATFTKPLIPLGPFIVADRSKEKVTLVARPQYVLGEPHFRSIVLNIFPTAESLEQALSRNTIDGVATIPSDVTIPAGFTTYTLQLPRKTAAFFNVDHESLKSLENRQKLSKRERIDAGMSLRVVTTESLAATDDVQKLLTDWRTANVTVNLSVLPSAQVQKTVIPTRDYDVVIFGIDYGPDPDPYPFWHSSQRTTSGLNLSNFANVDADHLLEAARKTGKADERTKEYEQFSKILEAQVPWLVIDDAPLTFAASKKIEGPQSAKGFVPTDRFANVQVWHRNR